MEVDKETLDLSVKIREDLESFIRKHGLRDVGDLVTRAVTFFLSCEKEDANVKISFNESGGVRLHFNEKDLIIEHAPGTL